MSAISSPKPAPVEEPRKVVAPPEPRRPRRTRWKLLAALAAVLVLVLAAYQLLLKPRVLAPPAPVAIIRTAPVTSGPLEHVVRLSGITSSITYVNVRAPSQRGPERRSLVLLELIPSGTRVNKGDVVARIDGQGLKDHIDDVNSTVQEAAADIKKRRAEQQVDWSNLEQNLLIAASERDKWKLEASAAEIRTVIDREILKLGVEESEARYRQLQRDLEFKKASHAAELAILNYTRERHIRHRDRHAYDLERYTIEAPMDGMAVRQQVFRGGEMRLIEQGDQLYPGMLFLKVMDTDNMQVEATINQSESSLFRIGQEARIGLDAFPGAEFKGKVFSIGALAKSSTQNPYVRDIPIRIRIEGSHPRLLPDLSAYADVIIRRVDNARRVPLGAVHEEAVQAYVYVQRGEKYEKRPVELGFRNYTHVQVLSGLEVGEQVALDLPVS